MSLSPVKAELSTSALVAFQGRVDDDVQKPSAQLDPLQSKNENKKRKWPFFNEGLLLLTEKSHFDKQIDKEWRVLRAAKGKYKKEAYIEHSRTGRLPQNVPLNRGSIFPHDRTIVSLKKGYINANFFRGYIQTQSPLKETIPTFWHMIFTHKVPIIVMLNEFSEYRVVRYWPAKREVEETYGKLHLKTLEHTTETVPGKKSAAVIDIRRILIKAKKKAPREVVHFHYTNWVDGKAPEASGVLKLIALVNLEYERHIASSQKKDQGRGKQTHFIAVHCNGGVGRTGTFCLLRDGLESQRNKIDFNIKNHLLEQRDPLKGRSPEMVTKEQYFASHRILAKHKKTFGSASQHSIAERWDEWLVSFNKEPESPSSKKADKPHSSRHRSGISKQDQEKLQKIVNLFTDNDEPAALKIAEELSSECLNRIHGNLWKLMNKPCSSGYGRIAFHNTEPFQVPLRKKILAVRQCLA